MSIKFEYNYSMGYNFNYSDVTLIGNGEWIIDEELLASDYSIEKNNYSSVCDFIKDRFEYMTELRCDACKFDSKDLNNLVDSITILNNEN